MRPLYESSFPAPTGRGDFLFSLAVIFDLPEIGIPLFNNILISCLNDAHNDFQLSAWNIGAIVAQKATTFLGNPNFCSFSEGIPSETCTWIGSKGFDSLDQK